MHPDKQLYSFTQVFYTKIFTNEQKSFLDTVANTSTTFKLWVYNVSWQACWTQTHLTPDKKFQTDKPDPLQTARGIVAMPPAFWQRQGALWGPKRYELQETDAQQGSQSESDTQKRLS